MNIRENISKSILKLLRKHKLSVKQFAKLTNLSYKTVKKLIDKKPENCRTLTLLKIVDTFNISMDEFVGYKR